MSGPQNMSNNTVFIERRGAVAMIVMNRPKDFNAMNMELMLDLVEAFETVKWDKSFRAVMIAGEGNAFCAGGDVKGMIEAAESAGDAGKYLEGLTKALHLVITNLRELPAPVVCAVNGVAAGAGVTLMLATDLVIIEEGAKIDLAYQRIGLTPDGGCTHFLVNHVGPKTAMEIITAGKVVTAQEAVALGLANKTAPKADLRDKCLTWAEKLASGPTLAIQRAKTLVQKAQDLSFEQIIEMERRNIIESGVTEDFKEGARAFKEKRKAEYAGK